MITLLFLLFLYGFDKSKDLYKIAGIDYSASTTEINTICSNYTNINTELNNTHYEALKILNNTYLRRIYDLYGYKGLENPHEYEGKQKEILKMQKIVPIYDFYKGCRYYFNFTRSRVCRCPNDELEKYKPTFMCSLCKGSATILETVQIELNLKKGSADPFIFTFNNFSDSNLDYSPGTIKIILKSEPTNFYLRHINDIFVWALEPLSSIYPGFQLSYLFIDDQIHYHNVTEVSKIIKIEGEGMPIEGTDRHGNLYIYFN